MTDSLYARLGGYDAIAAVAENLLSRLTTDPQLERFWKNRGEDGLRREKQLLIDFLCASAGGPLLYVGRDMKTAHKGMHQRKRLADLHRPPRGHALQFQGSGERAVCGAGIHRQHKA